MRPDTLGKPLQVLVHWACSKVSAASDVPDEALRDALVARLGRHANVRYATVAAHAQVGEGTPEAFCKMPKGLPNLLPSLCRSMWQLLSRAVYCAVLAGGA